MLCITDLLHCKTSKFILAKQINITTHFFRKNGTGKTKRIEWSNRSWFATGAQENINFRKNINWTNR